MRHIRASRGFFGTYDGYARCMALSMVQFLFGEGGKNGSMWYMMDSFAFAVCPAVLNRGQTDRTQRRRISSKCFPSSTQGINVVKFSSSI